MGGEEYLRRCCERFKFTEQQVFKGLSLLEQVNPRQVRNVAMVRKLYSGSTITELAHEYGITRGRVHQILLHVEHRAAGVLRKSSSANEDTGHSGWGEYQ